jgi:hypothetical protein
MCSPHPENIGGAVHIDIGVLLPLKCGRKTPRPLSEDSDGLASVAPQLTVCVRPVVLVMYKQSLWKLNERLGILGLCSPIPRRVKRLIQPDAVLAM